MTTAYGEGGYGAGSYSSTPALAPTDIPVAGELYVVGYYPTLNGQPVDVSSVDRLELFTTAARTGLPALTVQGPAVRTALGSYAFAAAVMPAAGIYHTVVTFRTGATVRQDSNDTLVVHAYDGAVGGSGGTSRLASVPLLREYLRDFAVEVSDSQLLLHLRTADEIAESIVGSLDVTPVPARWTEAALIIAAHLFDRWAGSTPTGYGTGSDENGGSGRGFAIPKAARELLEQGNSVESTGQAGPAFAFPPAELYPGEARWSPAGSGW